MNITINHAYPWGRSFEEYERMFALSAVDLGKVILGVGDGPASFNALMHQRGGRVVSCDPLYQFSADEIRERIEATRDIMIEKMRCDPDRFVWRHFDSPEAVVRVRVAAMKAFLNDYEPGRRRGRYLAQALPTLALADDTFDLALCSHLLFLYSDELSETFHVRSIMEMCRVAAEVRIFPLVDMRSRPSRHVQPVVTKLRSLGLEVSVDSVDYEFQRGGDQMMRVRRHEDDHTALESGGMRS